MIGRLGCSRFDYFLLGIRSEVDLATGLLFLVVGSRVCAFLISFGGLQICR